MAHNRPKRDDRSDNIEKLQSMVQNTIENIEKAHESMETANLEERERIVEKNRKREQSIENMRQEIKDEAAARENRYH